MSLKKTIGSILKWTARVFGILLSVLILLVAIGILFTPDYTKKENPAGLPINSTQYLTLDSRTKIWISVWLPTDLQSGETIPTLIQTSRYGNNFDPGWLYKAMQTYGMQPVMNFESAEPFLKNGYAYVWIQSPGSCQSSGPRVAEYPPNEIDAMDLAIDWIIRQPWSNQHVGAMGGSYSGTTADVCCATMNPALKAVHCVAPDFDPYTVIRPGGLGSTEFIQTWVRMIRFMDQDNTTGLLTLLDEPETIPFWKRLFYRSLIRGLQRPKGNDLAVFQQAMQDHRNTQDLYETLEQIEYKDQKMPDFDYSIEDVAMYRYREKIEKAQVSTYTRAGWFDAEVAKGVLQKYLTFNTPQKVVIGPTGHNLRNIVNLYEEKNGPSFSTAPKEICEEMFDFFDRHLKDDTAPKEERRILYFTHGVNQWNETQTWPPEGTKDQTWYLGPNHSLQTKPPQNNEGSDPYRVDFAATTGDQNRWMAQMGMAVHYGDRREEDRKLLTYTSAPLESDLEITGSPSIYLHLSSSHKDGAFHVYLEDISPEGRVTYLTEGLLRALHRKEKDPSEAPFVPLGIYHTFRKEDAEPLIPGKITKFGITLLPMSNVFKKGHSIRIAVAGHDKAMKDRCPEEGVPEINLQRNSVYPSRIILPVQVF